MTQQQGEFQAAVAQQQKEIQALTASLREQASNIQKVSEQLEVSKSATRLVVNTPKTASRIPVAVTFRA